MPATRERLRPVTSSAAVVFEPQQQQEQDDPDLTGQMGELADVAELDETALSEAQAADQVERDGRHADASSEPSEQSEREEDRAEFDQVRGWLCPRASQPLAKIFAAAAKPSGVPTATRRSPPVNVKSGFGDGLTCPARMTATMDTPVRVRMPVSPRVCPS